MKPTWTAHNIQITQDEFTIGSDRPTMIEDPIFVNTELILKQFYPSVEERKKARLIDLACLEGGYSVEFARLGFEVTGVEIRESNLQACNFVKDKVGLDNLRFVKDNVRNVERFGEFEIVFCCGILYHLDNPLKMLQSISKVTKKLLILNTHFSSESDNLTFNLSNLTEHEGFVGRWYPEFDTSKIADREIHRWASWDNDFSFWPTKYSLMEMLRSNGFEIVFEQYMRNLSNENPLRGGVPNYDRAQFVCVKV